MKDKESSAESAKLKINLYRIFSQKRIGEKIFLRFLVGILAVPHTYVKLEFKGSVNFYLVKSQEISIIIVGAILKFYKPKTLNLNQ